PFVDGRALSRAPAVSDAYPLSLHAALPICRDDHVPVVEVERFGEGGGEPGGDGLRALAGADAVNENPELIAAEASHHVALTEARDRKSTRLNSSHVKISYAVFCLKKKIIGR